MSLDIATPKGQISLQQEQSMLAIIETGHPGFRAIQTHKDKPADVDGFIVHGQSIMAVFESKCRDMTREQLAKFGNEWLVTFEKLQKGALIARALCVPLVGYLFLVPDKKVLSVRLTDERGNYLPKIRIERTETQATTNGGEIVRTNAYIDMSSAKEIG